ncbi:NAD(P)/FAD-dependent oxidoreductase [Prauserella cavernicola]|uniref:FAD-binding oxidoreductase n=1 Tax=Prauserella cavernicola TaxID=2800127 RepID=A0A934V353_9PSEU|nr:FAD-dependent oxidoreductase [Prauserella cavernicola]MBK1783249.1 FAD-binding oxidoreductase [Prauserella cavernicola]
MRVIVLGLGVVGAAVAANLAQRGHEVTVLDAAGAPALGTTSTTFAWVNANNKRPPHYQRLNADALREHLRLGGQDAGWLVQRGHLEYATGDDHRARLTERVERLRGLGYRAEFLDGTRAAELEPDLRVAPDALVGWFAEEAHCYPELFVAAMLGSAPVTVETGHTVTAVTGDGTVHLADGSRRTADQVVTCLGRHTGSLHPEVRMMEPEKGNAVVGFLGRTAPVPVRLSRVVTTASVNLRPAGGGALLAQTLDQDTHADPHGPVPEHVTETMRERIAQRVGMPVNIDAMLLGQRSLPADGLPVVGPVGPRSYVVTSHSAVTLAPLFGELVARELTGDEQERLTPYRPGRFAGATGDTNETGTVRPARLPGEQ